MCAGALDPDKDKELGELPGFPDAPTQRIGFDASRPYDMRQLTYILKRKKASLRPGPNQIPYSVYKKYPSLAQYLFNIFEIVRRLKNIPQEGCNGALLYITARGSFRTKPDFRKSLPQGFRRASVGLPQGFRRASAW